MGILYLRPSVDTNLQHSVSNSGSSGYLLINDSTADDDSSYIYQNVTSNSSTTVSSSFSFNSGTLLNAEISAITVYVRAMATDSDNRTAYLSYSCGGASRSKTSLTTSYSTYTLALQPSNLGLDSTTINGLVTVSPNITITTEGKKSRSKDDDFQIKVTQAYIAIRYDPIFPVYIGENRIKELYIGEQPVQEIYIGNTKIYTQ